jgi:hypothetical protein
MRTALIAVMILSAPTALSAAERADTSASQAGAEASDLDKILCRRDAETGSRVRKSRTCKTRGQWAKDADATRARWNEVRTNTGGGPPPLPPT